MDPMAPTIQLNVPDAVGLEFNVDRFTVGFSHPIQISSIKSPYIVYYMNNHTYIIHIYIILLSYHIIYHIYIYYHHINISTNFMFNINHLSCCDQILPLPGHERTHLRLDRRPPSRLGGSQRSAATADLAADELQLYSEKSKRNVYAHKIK